MAPASIDPGPIQPGSVQPDSGSELQEPLAPGLYLVATPIGNLEDITLRALRVLRSVDRIACEDTRQTAKLLHHFGISKPTVSYHQHNEAGRASQLVEELKAGARIAVVSDAGTPGIADPGAMLAAEAITSGVPVFPVPGANAALCALIGSGLPAERFTFHGFLPSKEGARRTELETLRALLLKCRAERNEGPAFGEGRRPEPETHIFYEAPHRILATLRDLVAVFGPDHRIALGRELTKLHEEFVRGTAAEVLATLESRMNIRGEMVLLLSGEATHAPEGKATSLADEVGALLTAGISEKEALKQVAKSRNLGKSEAYREWQRRKR